MMKSEKRSVIMDTNIMGRMKIYGEEEPENPDIRCIILLDLTEKTHGNALGMGLADLITRKFYEKIDFPGLVKELQGRDDIQIMDETLELVS